MSWRTSILMYHSISTVGGATAIAPEVFAAQMKLLAEARVPVLTLDDWYAARIAGKLPRRSVVITFDDGFQDFADVAWPVMKRYGFRPIVYLPTQFVGRPEGWRGIGAPPRALMDWATITRLAGEGVLFGSHTRTHSDLTELTPAQLIEELAVAKHEIEAELGCPCPHFAPPYGKAGRQEWAAIRGAYETSVGTRLNEAGPGDDRFDLPRLEMYYFTDLSSWRDHLAGRGSAYLVRRRALRWVRGRLMAPWAGL
ncbi:polysaccharide deacetylase family protein [Frigidibacter sp. RF13]|uniref:polysaccharide deacetylase family protein n=1 Tax=Frigidibacter sp. RF13 TaxID=2997340 RepID=UPI00226FC460|nr:polysaccharide deacetylase family protein [Frigidibacter sp. RF13]MCY1126680.1 polysaccharide deacetylase family protein [Frigidibacter sp. RF13]